MRKARLVNVTDGAIMLRVDEHDKVGPDENIEMTRASLSYLEDEPKEDRCRFFVQNLRSGDFMELAEKVILRAQKEEDVVRTDQFESQLYGLCNFMTALLYKFVFFFQGLLAGGLVFVLLLTTLFNNLSGDITKIDQVLRIAGFISCFGSLHTWRASQAKVEQSERLQLQSAAQDRLFFQVSLVSAFLYATCYVLLLVMHEYALRSNVAQWSSIQIGATVLGLLGWLFSVFNSKHSLEIDYREEE